jgi:hypothetical protein
MLQSPFKVRRSLPIPLQYPVILPQVPIGRAEGREAILVIEIRGPLRFAQFPAV